jgi:hypothetical protein
MSNKKMRPHSTPFLMDKYLKKDIFSTIYFQKINFFFKRGAIFLEGGNPPTCGHTYQTLRYQTLRYQTLRYASKRYATKRYATKPDFGKII